MKVRIQFSVDIDPTAWATTYGIVETAAIRQDVKDYVGHLVYETLREHELLARTLPEWHGTREGWEDHDCRCSRCRAAQRAHLEMNGGRR